MGSFRDFCKRTTISEQEEPEMIEKPQTIRRVVEKRRPNRMPRREEDVITESENMIATLQEKIEQVFYRFGLAGLERVDGAIINCVNEMINPDRAESSRASRKTATKQTTKADPKPTENRPLTVREIAAAALRDLPPMDSGHEVESAPVTERTTDYVPPEPPSYEPADPMAALEGEQLNEEEKVMLKQALAEAGNEAVAPPAHRDMSALSLAAKALQS